jgi:hypothetical protein
MATFTRNGWKLVSVVLIWMTGVIFVPGAAAQTGDGPENGTVVFQTVSGGPIYTVNSNGQNLSFLTTGMDPALSPDG